jgi:hypothetical protein
LDQLRFNVFYKTAECKFYKANACRNGGKCRFAHGTTHLHRGRDSFERESLCSTTCPTDGVAATSDIGSGQQATGLVPPTYSQLCTLADNLRVARAEQQDFMDAGRLLDTVSVGQKEHDVHGGVSENLIADVDDARREEILSKYRLFKARFDMLTKQRVNLRDEQMFDQMTHASSFPSSSLGSQAAFDPMPTPKSNTHDDREHFSSWSEFSLLQDSQTAILL